jgi:ABC-type multidrug transport system fused ATPase/permease subunit
LARALVREAPILILDEATSMLDAATEAEFFDSCRELFRERTVIVVSHQLSDLSFADQVVRLVGGRAELQASGQPRGAGQASSPRSPRSHKSVLGP